ncbi:MAG: hypothetical protein FWG98_07230 [Candidatus Cloacimonetes bacterium]|nr:hypothetical protein [Candidatus Cloacimonadota bacterium]
MKSEISATDMNYEIGDFCYGHEIGDFCYGVGFSERTPYSQFSILNS